MPQPARAIQDKHRITAQTTDSTFRNIIIPSFLEMAHLVSKKEKLRETRRASIRVSPKTSMIEPIGKANHERQMPSWLLALDMVLRMLKSNTLVFGRVIISYQHSFPSERTRRLAGHCRSFLRRQPLARLAGALTRWEKLTSSLHNAGLSVFGKLDPQHAITVFCSV